MMGEVKKSPDSENLLRGILGLVGYSRDEVERAVDRVKKPEAETVKAAEKLEQDLANLAKKSSK